MFDTTELEELTAKIAGLDEHLLADDDLLAGVRSIEMARRFLDGAEGAMLAELDARGTTDIATGHRTANWLARTCELSPAGARAKVNLARELRCTLPGTEQALREGRLCTDRARLMAGAVNERIEAEFRQLEADLIAESKTMTFDAFKRRLDLLVYLLDQDGPEPSDDVTNNRLRLETGADGTKVTGTLVGDASIVARQAIEQMADELWRRYRDDHEATAGQVEIPQRSTLRALAFAELCRRGLMVDLEGTKVTKPKVEATLVLNAETPDVVYVDGQPLVRGSDTALMCDMSVWTILMSSLGVPLDMGREVRNATCEQRKALKCRDGGCAFPGCGMRPEQCDAHHVAWWFRDLGTTDVKYMVFLCRHHHGVVHRTGWSIHIGDDGWCWITTPSGTSLWCQQHGVVRSGAPPPSGL